MIHPGKVFEIGSRLLERAASEFWILRLRWIDGLFQKCIQIGPKTRFHVPVVSGGKGCLVVGAENWFGYKLAPSSGNGQILLQPRAPEAKVVIGNRNAFSNNVSLLAMGSVVIGNDCLVGDHTTVIDWDGHEIDPIKRKYGVGQISPVHIGNNVWIGSRVMVLKGVTIGNNSVVAAMSVVTKSVPPNCVVGGNPAKFIRAIG
jgi:acetyltransferase-like isoleucine patch superfamily enzyme